MERFWPLSFFYMFGTGLFRIGCVCRIRETRNRKCYERSISRKSEKNFNLDRQVVFYYLIYYYNLFFYVTIRTYGLHKEIYDACPVQKNRVRRNIFAS